MKKIVGVKTDPDTGESYLDIKEFCDLFDIDEISYYDTEEKEDGTLVITFFDKDKNQLLPKGIQ